MDSVAGNSANNKVDHVLELGIPIEHCPLQGQDLVSRNLRLRVAEQRGPELAVAVDAELAGIRRLGLAGGRTDWRDLTQRLFDARCAQERFAKKSCELVQFRTTGLNTLLIHELVCQVNVHVRKRSRRIFQALEEGRHTFVPHIDAPLLEKEVDAYCHAQRGRRETFLAVGQSEGGSKVPQLGQDVPQFLVAAALGIPAKLQVV